MSWQHNLLKKQTLFSFCCSYTAISYISPVKISKNTFMKTAAIDYNRVARLLFSILEKCGIISHASLMIVVSLSHLFTSFVILIKKTKYFELEFLQNFNLLFFFFWKSTRFLLIFIFYLYHRYFLIRSLRNNFKKS